MAQQVQVLQPELAKAMAADSIIIEALRLPNTLFQSDTARVYLGTRKTVAIGPRSDALLAFDSYGIEGEPFNKEYSLSIKEPIANNQNGEIVYIGKEAPPHFKKEILRWNGERTVERLVAMTTPCFVNAALMYADGDEKIDSLTFAESLSDVRFLDSVAHGALHLYIKQLYGDYASGNDLHSPSGRCQINQILNYKEGPNPEQDLLLKLLHDLAAAGFEIDEARIEMFYKSDDFARRYPPQIL